MNWLDRMRAALTQKNNKMKRPMTSDGGEIHDPTPVAPPIGYNPSLSFEERIRIAIRSEHMAYLDEKAERESYADFHDFGPDDEDDEIFPASRFEQVAMDAQRLGRDYQRSKAERDRLEAAENRLAEKIGNAVRINEEYEDFEEAQRPRRPSSGARRRKAPEGRPEPPNPPSGDDNGE